MRASTVTAYHAIWHVTNSRAGEVERPKSASRPYGTNFSPLPHLYDVDALLGTRIIATLSVVILAVDRTVPHVCWGICFSLWVTVLSVGCYLSWVTRLCTNSIASGGNNSPMYAIRPALRVEIDT